MSVDLLQAPAVLLQGTPGSGKTYSLATLLKAGQKLAVVFTEPRGPESLLAACKDQNISVENLHWRYVPPAVSGWDNLLANAKLTNTLNYEALASQKSGQNKKNYTQFLDLLSVLADFTCERSGKHIGPIDELGTDWAVAVDSLSGINQMALGLTAGGKAALHPGEWRLAQQTALNLIDTLTSNVKAMLVLTSHVQRSVDEIEGGTQITVDGIGSKMGPQVPKNFSDAVFTSREGSTFWWSTARQHAITKARNLPISDKIKPDFGLILNAWKDRVALATGENNG